MAEEITLLGGAPWAANKLERYLNNVSTTPTKLISFPLPYTVRAIFITLAAFSVALTHAWCPGQSHVNLNTDTEQIDYSTLQFSVSNAKQLFAQPELVASYKEVFIPPPRTYVLGYPKFPVNIICGVEIPFCQNTLAEFNRTCLDVC